MPSSIAKLNYKNEKKLWFCLLAPKSNQSKHRRNMLLGQFQARLVGHPPSSSTTSAIDLRQGHLLELGAIYHRLRKFAGAGLNSQSASTGTH
jgi:hypothetical protein